MKVLGLRLALARSEVKGQGDAQGDDGQGYGKGYYACDYAQRDKGTEAITEVVYRGHNRIEKYGKGEYAANGGENIEESTHRW